MATFLYFTKMGHHINFAGCLPIRAGVFFCVLLQIGFIVFDLYEHEDLFDIPLSLKKSYVIDKWITFSIQIVVATLALVNCIFSNKHLANITYWTMIVSTLGITTLSILKIITISNMVLMKTILLCVYILRYVLEMVTYFYSTYVSFSFAECYSGTTWKVGLLH